MKTKHIALCALALAVSACTHKPANQERPTAGGLVLENLDPTIQPQEDFYQYACGGWMEINPLTEEYARFGSFDKLGEENRKQLQGLIEEIASQPQEAGSIGQKIADLYNLAMDSVRRNAEGAAPLQPVLDKIDAVNDKAAFSTLIPDLYMDGVGLLFHVFVDADAMNSAMNMLQTYQSGYALGEKEYYLDNDSATLDIRNKYVAHIAEMFGLFGANEEESAAAAATVLRMETRLANAAFSNIELRNPHANYNKMKVAELQALVPEIEWTTFFNTLGVAVDELSVSQTKHLQEVGKLIGEESIEDMKTFLKWQAMNAAASSLSDEIYTSHFNFFSTVLRGTTTQSPRWKRAVGVVNSTLGEAVGQMYVQKYFPAEAKERMLNLVKNLQNSLSERINNLEWMSEATKAKAQEKLQAFHVKIGYPDTWRDYTDLEINAADSYLTNGMRANRFETAYGFSFAGKPVDKDKWLITPQTVNAYYNPTTNEICFPAGILQYPFFDMSADDAFNYGAIGVVIGHEMTHGFDDQGCQFDKDGNLNNWWAAEDKAKFDARAQVLVDYFDKIEVAPGVFANGRFTLGENIADHGGLQIAYQAFKTATKDAPLDTIAGLSPEQRFFLSYADVWAGNIREEEILSRTKSDPHSLGRWRVNGALPHVGAWYEAFHVTEESPMYLAPENRVSIW